MPIGIYLFCFAFRVSGFVFRPR